MDKTIIWPAVDPKQYASWKYQEERLCPIKKLLTKPAPMPWGLISQN